MTEDDLGPAATTAEVAAPPRDPARGLRAIGAALLSMHAIVVALAIPVVAHRDSGSSTAGVAWLAAIAVLDLVVAGVLARAERAGIVAGSALLAATVAAGVLSAFLLVIGVVFAGLWVGWLAMRRSLAAELAAATKVRAAPTNPDADASALPTRSRTTGDRDP